jgi:dTMP kinase
MPTPRYPLEPLARLRESRIEAAERALARATAARVAAQQTRTDAERAAEEHRRTTLALRAAEREALARGELRALDLAREDAWAARRAAEAVRMAGDAAEARAAEERARSAEQSARAAAASCAADARVVRDHRERWARERRATAEGVEDDAAIEAWRAKR